MSGLRYPWSVLGIPPTGDERAIQKAYAAKLRVTRPDEDPKGFQELREARDHAMAVRLHHVETVDEREIVASSPEPIAVRVDPEVDPGPVPSATISAEPGSVILAQPPVTAEEPSTDDAPDVADLLERVGTPHPWRDLKAQWAEVFDAMEHAPLADHGYDMWAVLNRLIADIRQRVGQIPDITDWQGDPRAGDRGPLGPYGDILGDFDARFGILRQDSMLLDYMDEEDARDLTTVLSIAVGRRAMPQPTIRPEINVEPLEQGFIESAWADDPKMLDFCRKAREADEFPWSFSWLALLFPLPFALYYRLTGVAALAAILVVANATFAVMRLRGLPTPFAPMASTVYLVVAAAIAFNSRRIRFQALAGQVRRLRGAGLGQTEIDENVRAWGRPSPAGMWLGVIVLVLAVAGRVLAR